MMWLRNLGLVALGAVLALSAWIAINGVSGLTGNSGERVGEFEQRVRNYLLNNPQVLVEAAQRLRENQQAAQINEVGQVIAARSNEIFNDADTPVGGNPEGDVTLVEFFDYNCPYCRRMAPTLVEIENSDPGLRIVYKEWPILGPNSEFAARAALASRNQDKYVVFHKALMLESGLVDEWKVMEIAARFGIDLDRLKLDMEAPDIMGLIERNRELARSLRITGTPSFVIGDLMLRGAAEAETIRGYIRRARQRQHQSSPQRSDSRNVQPAHGGDRTRGTK